MNATADPAGRVGIPRVADADVLARPRAAAALRAEAARTGRPLASIEAQARGYLREMAARHTLPGIRRAAALGRYLYQRAYDARIDLLPADVERVRALMQQRPVAFGFTHKSHIDGFMLVALFHDFELPPLHFFGGINMSFAGLGTVMKKGGAVFIRRSFQDNPVYKIVFKNYIDYLGEKRFPLLWALEGTRSRTGKMVPFRLGLISYVVNAYVREHISDLVLMPIAVTYDQVPEVTEYDALQAGGGKRPESVSWFMGYIRRLRQRHGKIHLRFGQGVNLADFVDASQRESDVDPAVIQKIAFALAVDVSRVMPVTVNSLITFVMLTHGHQAMTLDELRSELAPLRAWVRRYQLPATDDVERWDERILQQSLQLLASHRVVIIDTSGLEPVYSIAPGAARRAAYYRNATIHFFVRAAIGELALLAAASDTARGVDRCRQAALQLRDLLKYEFFFEDRQHFVESLEGELDGRVPDWRTALTEGPQAVRARLLSTDLVLAPGALRPFFESYWLVAEALASLPRDQAIDSPALMTRSLTLGRQRLLQRRIRCEESISSNYFENAIRMAERRGLLASQGAADARSAWARELRSVVELTRQLASLAESRHLDPAAEPR